MTKNTKTLFSFRFSLTEFTEKPTHEQYSGVSIVPSRRRRLRRISSRIHGRSRNRWKKFGFDVSQHGSRTIRLAYRFGFTFSSVEKGRGYVCAPARAVCVCVCVCALVWLGGLGVEGRTREVNAFGEHIIWIIPVDGDRFKGWSVCSLVNYSLCPRRSYHFIMLRYYRHQQVLPFTCAHAHARGVLLLLLRTRGAYAPVFNKYETL